MRSEVYSKEKWEDILEKGKKKFLYNTLLIYCVIGVLLTAGFNEYIIRYYELQPTTIQRIIIQLISPIAFYGLSAVVITEKVWIINNDIRRDGPSKSKSNTLILLTFIEYMTMLIPLGVFNIHINVAEGNSFIIKLLVISVGVLFYIMISFKITSKAIIKDLEISEKRKY